MLHGRLLRYLDEVVRSGSIRKAATRLNVASSAINRQIIALEQELGEPLFERMPKGLRLTSTGEILIQHIRDTLKDYERARLRVEALRGLHRGSVALSTTLGLAAGPMADIINEYLESYPRVQVRVSSLVSEAISNAVLSGEVALGLGFNILPRPGLKTIFAMDVPLGAITAVDHPLAARTTVRLGEIVEHPLVMAESGMSLRRSIDLALSRFSNLPPPVVETNSVEMMRNFVGRSKAVTFLNPLDVMSDVAAGRLCYLPITDENLHPQTLRLVVRDKSALDAVASRFAQHLITTLSALRDAYQMGGGSDADLPGDA